MGLTGFMNKNLKPLMMAYYKKKYRMDIYRMLCLYNNYGKITFEEAISIMSCDYNGDLKKAAKIWGICVYCGFLETCK